MGDGDEPEAGQGRVGGLDLVEADGGQVAQQGVEAVYWQVVWVCLVASAVPAGSGWRGATGLRPAVRAENRIHGSDEQGWSPGAPSVMITDHVPAVRVLLITRLATWLRLSRRKETWKTAETLILPGQEHGQGRAPHPSTT